MRRNQAAGVYITAAAGPEIPCRKERSGLRTLKEANGAMFNFAVGFQHP